MANQVSVNGSGVVQINVATTPNIQVNTGRTVIANITNVPSANTANTANYAGNVTGNAQPNITSVGTLISLAVTGNVTGNYFIGNGYTLTSINGANITGNISGNISNAVYAEFAGVAATANSVAGANVTGTVANATYALFAGTANTANSVQGSNVIGSVAQANFANTANAVSGANVSGTVANAQFANFAGTANTANAVDGANVTGIVANANYAAFSGNVVNSAQPNITSVGTLTALLVTGNVSANYFVGNGYTLTSINGANVIGNISGNISNADYATFAGTANTANVANSVSGANVVGSVAQANFANTANAVSGANVSGAVANAVYSDFSGVAASANSVAGANVVGPVAFATTANNVAGANVSGIVANANYAAYSGNVVNASQPNITSLGTLTGLNVSGDALVTGNLIVDGNLVYVNVENFNVEDPIVELGGGANGAPLTTNDGKDRGAILHYYNGTPIDAFMGYDNSNAELLLATNVSITNEVVTVNGLGNVRAGNIIGNLYGVANSAITAATVTQNSQPNITSVGNLSNLTVTGNVSANFYTGNGSLLTGVIAADGNANYANFAGNAFSVDGANVVGSVAQANFANTANAVAGANVSGTVANAQYSNFAGVAGSANSVAGANVSGIVADANYAAYSGNVINASQPNITSVGNLTSLAVSGNANVSGNVTATYFIGDGSKLTGIAPTVQVYEFANIITTGGYYQATWLSNYTANALTSVSQTVTATPTLLAGFITESGYPNITVLPVGVIGLTFETIKASGTRSYYCYAEIYKRDVGGIETLLVTSDSTTVIDLNTLIQQSVSAVITTPITILNTDRIVVKIYAALNTGAGSATISIQFDDNTNSGLQLPALPASSAQFVPYTNPTANVNLGTYGLTGNFLTATANITANYYFGNGALLSGIVAAGGNANYANFAGNAFSVDGANVVGPVAFATTANSVAGANVSGTVANAVYADFSGVAASANAVAGANVSGIVANANYAAFSGNVTNNAQPNITSVGTLANLTVTGNVSANYYIGNGSLLTGIATGTPNAIVNGSSNVTVDANSNVRVSVAGTANTVVFTSINTIFNSGSGGNITGANLVSANFFSGNGSLLTSINASNVVGIVANANYAAYSANVTGNAQPNITSVGTLANLTVTGNVSANYFLGNGSQLTGLPSGNAAGSNTQIQFNDNNAFAGSSKLTFDKNIDLFKVTGNGNITDTLFVGSNVISYGNMSANVIYATSNIISYGNTFAGNTIVGSDLLVYGKTNLGQVANVKILGGSNLQVLSTDGTGNLNWVTATGGSGTPGGSNTNIQFNDAGVFGGSNAFTFDKTSNVITASGNIAANFFTGNGSLLTGIATGTPNAIVNGTSNVSIPSANGNVVINASGNLAITATSSNVVIGTGSGANITGANNISANTFTGTLTTAAQPNITSVGTLSNANITGAVAVGNGTAAAPSITFINDTNTGIYNVGADQLGISTGGTLRQTIANAAITATVPHYVANGTAAAPSYTFTSDTNTGIFATGTADQIAMATGGTQRFLLSNTSANFAGNVIATGNVQGNYVLGNGALLTGITTDATSITNGTSNVRAAASGNVTVSVAGTSNVITVTSTNLIVNAVSQLGNLGNVKITGGTNGYFLQTDGVGNLVWAAGTVNATGNGTVAGSNTQIQFNDGASNFAASGALTFDTSSNTLTVGGFANVTGNLSVGNTANISKLNLVQFDETVLTNASVSGTITPDVNTGTIFNYTLSGNVTINALGNAVAGVSATIILKQDTTGNRLLTSNMLFAGNSKTLTTSANAIDIMSVFFDGSTYYAALTKGYV